MGTFPVWKNFFMGVAVLACLPAATVRAAEERVHVELVLALDVSASVDRAEFALQLEGIAAAFRDPEVLQAVADLQPLGAAIAVAQWGGPEEYRLTMPFTHVATAQDAKAFGFVVSRSYRFTAATTTSITTAMARSADLFDANGFDGGRRVIDISGDGRDNSGLDLAATRKALAARRITVNGLAISEDDNSMEDYFRTHVITGPNAFVEPANGYDDFARAIKAKLIRELQPDAS